MDFFKSLKTFTNANIIENENASKYFGYKTGGKVRYFIDITRVKDLKDAIEFCLENDVKYKIVGNGTNILLSDEGYDGAILHTALLNQIFIEKDSVTAFAGAKLNDFIRLLALNGYDSFVNLSGIPATVGGAVVMNASAFNTSISDDLLSVYCLKGGKERIIDKSDCEFGYRTSKFLGSDMAVVSAKFSLENFVGAKNAVLKYGDVLRKRKIIQPFGKSCGSVFKNPHGDYAGSLIERAGLKGYNINGAMVSDKHANFILNTGNATSKDIYELIKHIKEQVLSKFNVTLNEEIEYLGSF